MNKSKEVDKKQRGKGRMLKYEKYDIDEYSMDDFQTDVDWLEAHGISKGDAKDFILSLLLRELDEDVKAKIKKRRKR